MFNSKGLKGLVALAALSATTISSAEVTGTANIASEYMFRGIPSSGGAAVQGSIDYAHESGLYGGLWASNLSPFAGDGNELDVIVGWSGEVMSGLSLDVGAIYYLFTEDEQFSAATPANAPAAATGPLIPDYDGDGDYWEIYAGGGFGPVSLTVYYADDFFGVDGANLVGANPLNGALVADGQADGDMIYITADYTLAVKEDLDVVFQIGHSSGDGVEAFIGNTYTDWSIGLTKSLENEFSVTLAYHDTDLDLDGFESTVFGPSGLEFDDDAKFVISLSKGFDI